MALKRILESLDGVPADVAKEYTEVDGKFVLDIEGDDLTPLKNAKNHEREAHNQTKAKLIKAEQDLLDLRRGAVSKDDLDAIETSYKGKLTEGEEREKALKKRIDRLTIGSKATEIANKLFTAPGLVTSMIAKRLTVEIEEDGEPVYRVKGQDGKASALTLADLEKELVANEELRAILKGSSGSGGQGGGQGGGGGGGATKKLSEMTEAERIALYRSNPDEFRRLKAEAGA